MKGKYHILSSFCFWVDKDFNFLSSANLSLDDDEEHLSVLFAKLEKLFVIQQGESSLREMEGGVKSFKYILVFFIENLLEDMRI